MDTTNFVDIEVPEHGCLFDRQEFEFDEDLEKVKDNVWNIGGTRGWYYWDWAWEIRGFLDILFGGVGLRRGRRGGMELYQGDALDFWRVLIANRKEGHLALYAEMKLPRVELIPRSLIKKLCRLKAVRDCILLESLWMLLAG